MTSAKATPETVTLHIQFRIMKRGGRKEMQLPDGASSQHKVDNTLVKALARAFRWKRMLKSGEFTTIAELAAHENIAPSYMTRVLRLTLLAPDIVEAILDGRQAPEMALALLLEPFPEEWERQIEQLARSPSSQCFRSPAGKRTGRTGRKEIREAKDLHG